MAKKLIELKNISKSFGDNLVLNNLNLYINENEFITLLGPSGCGKTTLLRIVGGFEETDNGDVILDGVKINDVPPHLRPVNTVFQRYALFPHLNVFDNVAFGLRNFNRTISDIKTNVSRKYENERKIIENKLKAKNITKEDLLKEKYTRIRQIYNDELPYIGLYSNFYEVDDKKEGLSVYGKTKSEGEDFVTSLLTKYFIVRISWVFGINGNNFVKTMIKLAKANKKELNVVCDQIGSPTYTYDLAKLLCDMIETNKYGIYHATNEGVCSWAKFAKEIFKLTNFDVKVNEVTTLQYQALVPNQAARPLNSRLSKKSLTNNGFKLLPTWEDALRRFIEELKNKGEI